MPVEDFDLASIQDGNRGMAPEPADRDPQAPRRGIIDDFTLPTNLEAKLKRRRSRSRDRDDFNKDWSKSC